jgi:hypothetical protein
LVEQLRWGSETVWDSEAIFEAETLGKRAFLYLVGVVFGTMAIAAILAVVVGPPSGLLPSGQATPCPSWSKQRRRDPFLPN